MSSKSVIIFAIFIINVMIVNADECTVKITDFKPYTARIIACCGQFSEKDVILAFRSPDGACFHVKIGKGGPKSSEQCDIYQCKGASSCSSGSSSFSGNGHGNVVVSSHAGTGAGIGGFHNSGKFPDFNNFGNFKMPRFPGWD